MGSRRSLRGPARFFATHRGAYAASLLGAAAAALLFCVRGSRSRGARRHAWWMLAAFQLVQIAGIRSFGSGASAGRGERV